MIVCATAALVAHAWLAMRAGAPWRDEANTLAFARMTSLAELFGQLRHDSAPPAVALLVRFALACGLDSDGALRALGAAIGLATLAFAWTPLRGLGARFPVVTMSLFALNAWVVRGGDALRPQGLAMLAVVLATWTAARAACHPGRGAAALAGVAAAFATSCAWTTVPLTAALACALVAVAARERRPAFALAAFAVLAGIALALLPALGAIRAAREWGELVRTGTRFASALEALGPGWPERVAWTAASGMALVAGLRAVAAPGVAPLSTFSLVALACGTAATLALMVASRLPTQPWYYLPLMTMVTLMLDLLLTPLLLGPRMRTAVAALLLVAAPWQLTRAWDLLGERATNLDRVAERLAHVATANDLVVLTPWQLGVSWSRVAPGHVRWTTLPPLADSRIHRYDLVREAMRRPEVAERVSGLAIATLERGGRVFVVGGLPPVRSGEQAPLPPPAPIPGLGWNSDAYTLLWARHFATSVVPHLSDAREIAIDAGPVSRYEQVELIVLEGSPR